MEDLKKEEIKKVRHIRVEDEAWENFRLLCSLKRIKEGDMFKELINIYILKYKDDLKTKIKNVLD